MTAAVLRDVRLTEWLVRVLRLAPEVARPVLWQLHHA